MQAQATILVQNRTARVLGPSYRNENGQGAIVRLLPGINKVPSELWGKVHEDPLVTHHRNTGELVLLEDNPELAKMPLTRACEVVAGTFDKAMLREWRQGEERKPVVAAIDAQLERLDGSKPDEEQRPETVGRSPLGPAGAGVDVSAPRGRRRQ